MSLAPQRQGAAASPCVAARLDRAPAAVASTKSVPIKWCRDA
jgi:hypothetical protein